MQLPEVPPLPLAPLWDRVLRARTLPPDLDVELLYNAIRDRLTHPEWEVRLNALRVLADVLPLSGNALAFPFDEVVDNLGHNSPNVRKGALDALKVFCMHCEDPECAASAILDKSSYHNIRPQSASIENKINVITGLVLSLPSVMGILRRRHQTLNLYPTFQVLGDKLLDHVHRDVAQRSLLKMRQICGPKEYMACLSKLDRVIQDKFRLLCDIYDEDSIDVYYAPRRAYSEPKSGRQHIISHPMNTPFRISSDSTSDASIEYTPYNNNIHSGKVIVETELQFDQNTAITMQVLEENETESERNGASEEDYDSADRNMLKYSDGDSEDPDVVIKKVRFGGECIKIRTPDSDNFHTSEDENKEKTDSPENAHKDNIEEAIKPSTPIIVTRMNEIKREALERESRTKPLRRSGIPLPVINHSLKNKNKNSMIKSRLKSKSKSLSELHEYFKAKNNFDNLHNSKHSGLGFAWTLADMQTSDPIPSPVEQHREVEVLHNLQKSPVLSPRKQRKHVHFEPDSFVLNLISSSSALEMAMLSPRQPSPLREHYEWEDQNVVPRNVVEQLHNTDNWISAVKAADLLHSALLDAANVRKVEASAVSLVSHMWALSDSVSAARAPAEGAVCALFRGARNEFAREMLQPMVARMAKEPPLTAVPQALLQRLALHHLVDLIFDPEYIKVSGTSDRVQEAQLRAALCVARAAGPAAVLSAVRRRLTGTARADIFCNKLRERLNRPIDTAKQLHVSRSSQLPVLVRRRARSTPTPTPVPPRRLRPLPESAPLPGVFTNSAGKEIILKPLSPIHFNDKYKDSSYTSVQSQKANEKKSCEPNITHTSDTNERDDRDEVDRIQSRSPSPSIKSRKTPSPKSVSRYSVDSKSTKSNKSLGRSESPKSVLRTTTPLKCPSEPVSRAATPTSYGSRSLTPEPVISDYDKQSIGETCQSVSEEGTRDVRSALVECAVPVRHEDWQLIVSGLQETQRLASDQRARAPAQSWRASARTAALHVRSLRSRVARVACEAVGALFEHHGRALDSELEEAAAALLDRCADVNRFLRADATEALARMACGSECARVVMALVRRGAAHRAGPVRAAAASALARLATHCGGSRLLDLPPEPRTLLLRVAGELLADAHPDTRQHARSLCLSLAEDKRFKQLLKDSMLPNRYRAIEKNIEKLRTR